MSDSVEVGVAKPVRDPEPDATGNSNTEATASTKAESVEGDDLASDDSQITGFTPINPAAGAELDEMTPEESKEPTAAVTDVIPKKRAAADNSESEQPSKKRSPPKGKTGMAVKNKNSSSKSKKNTATTDNNTGAGEATSPKQKRGPAKATNGDIDAMEEVVPVTPKKRTPKSKGKKVKAEEPGTEVVASASGSTQTGADGMGENAKGEARKRMAPKKAVATPKEIPSTWDEADEADKMLVNMRDSGEDWITIRAAWEAATGQVTAGSSLPNRYGRIKVHLMELKEGDDERLLTAKAEVEAKFQAEKFSLIAASIEKAGGDKYPAKFLQKVLKKMEAKGKGPMPRGGNTNEDEDD